ncbi:phosphoketolase family protein [Arthrobacter bambusae]|uniref:Xylulose-5-phosphate/fructose-6-phosphate phosphoketolase n=1 Tax=Arthrobacter bambusae TaxID=1338426 RepID=A0AAW8DFS7_9MICC|nr:phosphoketolase family protein [Arthrobacter bambusae]MDP9904487.1 xylulose-5-phosphate/fructose-6-phosphate phosphoketolase [Arthrobacter bambusae]MDQ0127517.1 xylulose-5-phosphate/fructose-6-phosphate phosphoketolase [Arthrobacter bambusae]MDQ0178860.1 xylulose-5-phosphate/fructose-6-phosphate phosphoketolase [Arthrobacter bambusae]
METGTPVTGASAEDFELLNRYWSAANYLTVAQIYLQENPLLREPLLPRHIKPRLLGHWGTSPGLSLIYAHLNRLIRRTSAEVLFVAGPGHGGPAVVANVYLEGTYSEIYPKVGMDLQGLRRLVRQFSTPGGIASHVGPATPGSIHEGGELGYSLMHATGAAMDNPGLIVACVIGDGEAETGPLEASWKAPSFLNPARDGAVLPILHLNGYKISGPTVLGRKSDEDVEALLSAHGWDPVTVSGEGPVLVHRALASAMDESYGRIRELQSTARSQGVHGPARWPAIILRTPKGWSGPAMVDGLPVEGTFRSHQVPLADVRENPEHLAQLEAWMRSYQPETLFDDAGRLVSELAALVPEGSLRMGAARAGRGGTGTVLEIPGLEQYAVPAAPRGSVVHETTRPLGELLRDVYIATAPDPRFRLFCPDETNSNRLGAVFEATDRCLLEPARAGDHAATEDHVSPGGRVMEVLSEHLCQGWLEGYLLTGRHGLFASYEAFAMVSASMTVQHAKWLQHARELEWRAPVPSLNILLTSTCWRNDHNGFSHQGPGLIDTVLSLSGTVTRVYLPPDANTLLVTADHILRSKDYVNLVVVDKQPHPQYLTLEEARRHAEAGASIWSWAGNEQSFGGEPDGARAVPDVVLACAGDIPTQETLAAAWLLQEHLPGLVVRVVNVMDAMVLPPRDAHPHGLSSEKFEELFTADREVIMAWHGYARALHQLLHGRPRPERFHVRGYNEQGTTTTPFDMVVLNKMSRYHLVLEALRRIHRQVGGADELVDFCRRQLDAHARYIREHFEDLPEIRDWSWTPHLP